MTSMLHGETVTVEFLVSSGVDDYGNNKYERNSYQVDNVLVSPTQTMDLDGNLRGSGDATTLTLYFPKAFSTNPGLWRGAEVIVRSDRYQVQGSPFSYDQLLTPTSWYFVVEVKRVEG